MSYISARTQPIIANSTPDMIHDHFLPIATILQHNSQIVERREKQLLASKHGSSETADLEADVQQVRGGGEREREGGGVLTVENFARNKVN